MAKILIIGAGASHGHGVDGVKRPPLANGFFDLTNDSQIKVKYKDLFSYVQKSCDIDLSNQPTLDIEKLFQMVESGWTLSGFDFDSGRSKYGIAVACLSPIDMLRSFVVEGVYSSTRWLNERECPFHSKIANCWLNPDDTVISFNYDLLIDVSLKQSGNWNEQYGYGFYQENTINANQEILLLKPHGSLNWFLEHKLKNTPVQNNSIQKEQYFNNEPSYDSNIFIMPLKKALLGFSKTCEEPDAITRVMHEIITSFKNAESGSNGPTVDGLLVFWRPIFENYKNHFLSAAGHLPNLVFPTPFKNLDHMVQLELKQVWQQIRNRLIECDEIHAIGFSFRDDHFNQLMKQASTERDNPLCINYWSKNENDFESVSNTLCSNKLKLKQHFGWLKEFISSI